MFLASGDKGATIYGVEVLLRMKFFAQLHVLAVNYPVTDRWAAAAISLLLLGSFGVVSWRSSHNRQGS